MQLTLIDVRDAEMLQICNDMSTVRIQWGCLQSTVERRLVVFIRRGTLTE